MSLSVNYTIAITNLHLAVDADRVEVFLGTPTGHVFLEVGDVTHEAQTVLRRVR